MSMTDQALSTLTADRLAEFQQAQIGDRIEVAPGIFARIASLAEFKPDPNNANLHTERGRAMLENEIQTDGFGRPTFAAKDGTILGGNMTLEVSGAIELGGGRVVVIETDGKIPIVHQRTDIVDPNSEVARGLATADNRIAQVSLNFDPKAIAQLKEQHPKVVKRLFFSDEVNKIIQKQPAEEEDEPEELINIGEQLREKWGTALGQLWGMGKFTRCPKCGKVHPLK